MRSLSRERAARRAKTSTSHDRWLVSYADFLTLLFAFFVVLFASMRQNNLNFQKVSTSIHAGFDTMGAHPDHNNSVATVATPAPAKRAPTASPASLDLSEELRTVLSDSISKHQIVLQQSPEGLIISLRELGFFHSGEAQLLPAARQQLQQTAGVLMSHHLTVRVEGHSDDQPIHTNLFHSNWELSTSRAMSVLLVLVDESGFDPEKISIAGYGPYRPIASNATTEGRQMNRRVDLVVLTNPAARPSSGQ